MRLTSVLRRVSANHILAPAPTPPQKNLPMEAASNFYSGAPPLNRLSFHRHNSSLLGQHLCHPLTKFVVLKAGEPLVNASDRQLAFLGWTDNRGEGVLKLLGGKKEGPWFKEDGGGKERHLQGARVDGRVPLVFLGIDERGVTEQGKTLLVKDPSPHLNETSPPVFALDAASLDAQDLALLTGGNDERVFAEPRGAANGWPYWEAGVFAEAKSLVDWNARNKFCAGCGSKVYSLWGGWKLSCSSALAEGGSDCPSQKGLHNYAYPRTDPVIIMGIVSLDGESLLLGRQKAWPKGMYSCLAGFLEPGESLEDSVRREVYEEAGVVVQEVIYHSSQPWPYPSNLMIGCFGRADPNQSIRLDLDNELEDARWFTRAELLTVLADPNGTVIRTEEQKYFNPDIPKDEDRTRVPEVKKTYRLPPTTAIAGVLCRGWAEGTVVALGGKPKPKPKDMANL